jgi:hypothetical protein
MSSYIQAIVPRRCAASHPAPVFVLVALLLAPLAADAAAQQPPAPPSSAQPDVTREGLGDRVRHRFDPVWLQDGVGLIPRGPIAGVRLVEVRGGTVAINGEVVTGRELRDRVGADADLILQLSYLADDARRTVLGLSTRQPEVEQRRSTETPAPPPPTTPEAPPAVESAEPRRERRRGDLLRIGGNVTVSRDEYVEGDVVVMGGSATIDGEVTGDVVVIAGTMRLGPEADIHRDATVVAGLVDRTPTSRVRGSVNEIAVGWPAERLRNREALPEIFGAARRPARFGGLIFTVLRFGLLLVVVCLSVIAAPRLTERIGARAAAEPLKAGIAGFLAELLIGPGLVLLIVILAISIIGIPLLFLIPFALLALVGVFVVAFASVAGRVGSALGPRLGWSLTPIGAATLGVAALLMPALVASVFYLGGGFFGAIAVLFTITAVLVEFGAWTVGFGAAILSRFSPPVPPALAGTPAAPPLPSVTTVEP